jgi:hypothetical protein
MLFAATLFAAAARGRAARADAPVAAASERSWEDRWEEAEALFTAGRYREASSAFHALARSAASEADRVRAHEMGRLASESADRIEQGPPPPPPSTRAVRSSDELALLYASGFLYGAGSGVWFLLSTEPDSALTATLPFVAITAAPIVAIATIDGVRPFPRGLPHAISAGLYLGLGQGVFVIGLQQARAVRLRSEDPASDARFRPETVAGLLWGGATLGATLGGALGAGLQTTPGRVSFTASTTIWSGVITGLAAGAILPTGPWRSERAFEIGLAGYDLGLAGGLLLAGKVSPSVARVRIADLAAIGGGVVAAGAYLSIARDPDRRAAEGIAAAGLAAGLATGWLLTSGMGRELPNADPSARTTSSVEPRVVPVPAGAALGVGGVF